MNISRQSTLLLTLAIAVLTLGYANVSFAVKPVCPGTHPSCDGDEDPPGPAAVYTAALTIGGFIFGPVEVTPNKKETSYHSNFPVNMDRPLADGSLDQLAWDGVFDACVPPKLSDPRLLSDPINSVFVGRDDWKIVNTGRNVTENPDSTIRIRFMDVVDGTVDIDFDLFGVRGNDPFLPASGDTSVFTLNRAVIFGQDRNLGCRSDNFDLLTNSVLKIKRK